MKLQERAEIHELTADDIDYVSGGGKFLDAVNDVVQTAAGAAIVVWDLATNWKDPWA